MVITVELGIVLGCYVNSVCKGCFDGLSRVNQMKLTRVSRVTCMRCQIEFAYHFTPAAILCLNRDKSCLLSCTPKDLSKQIHRKMIRNTLSFWLDS